MGFIDETNTETLGNLPEVTYKEARLEALRYSEEFECITVGYLYLIHSPTFPEFRTY